MPRKILASQRARFWRLYRTENYSIKDAAQRAGFSESYGKKLVRNGVGGPPGATSNESIAVQAKAVDDEVGGRPKRPHELSDVARDCLEDFARFRALYLGSITVPWQIEAAEMVVKHLDTDDDSYGVVNAPQGAGKTRLFTHDIPAWLTVRDRTMRGCLGSGTIRVSERMTGNLRTTLARRSPVSAADRWKRRGMAMDAKYALSDPVNGYGRFKPIMPGIVWTKGEFSVEQFWEQVPENLAELAEYIGAGQDKEATWAAFSKEAQVMSLRFDFMNWDDLHTHRELRNPDVMQDLFDWWEVEAESRLDPGGLCLVTMQRLGANDISKHLLSKVDPAFEIDADRPDEPPRQYFHVVYKAHYDDRCLGQHGPDAPMYPEGCMLDPKRLSEQKQNAKKVAGTYEVVYQQQDTDPKDVLVQREWVDGGVGRDGVDYPGCWDTDRHLGQLPRVPPGSFTIRYMTVDPSPTRWWYLFDNLYVLPSDVKEPLAGYRYVIQALRAKLQAPELLDWSRNQGDKYVGIAEEWVQYAKGQGVPIEFFIMEKNAAQRWAMQYEFFNNWKMSRGVNVLPHETMRNKTDPDLGVEATLPSVFRHGRVRLPGGDRDAKYSVLPFVQEVTTYPNGSTTDGVMSFWFGEYNLQHLVARRNTGSRVHRDIPSWMRER